MNTVKVHSNDHIDYIDYINNIEYIIDEKQVIEPINQINNKVYSINTLNEPNKNEIDKDYKDYKDLISHDIHTNQNENTNNNKKIKLLQNKQKASQKITTRLLSNQSNSNFNLTRYDQCKGTFPKDDTSFIKTKKKLSVEMELTSSDGMRKLKNVVKTHKLQFKTKKIDEFSLEDDDLVGDLGLVKSNTMSLCKVGNRERSMSSIIYKLGRGVINEESDE